MSAFPKPMLTLGSYGEAVRLVQKAFNLAPSKLAKLAEDAAFGPLTLNRTREFQKDHKLVSDGIVGPQTYAELQPFIDFVNQVAAKIPVVPGQDEQMYRDRIVHAAEQFMTGFSWHKSPLMPGDFTGAEPYRIAAARGYGPKFLSTLTGKMARMRYGGTALAYIFQLAGAPSEKCHTIIAEYEPLYQSATITPEIRAKLNHDLGSWCGIFAVACYRLAGLNLKWSTAKEWAGKQFEVLQHNDAVRKGDIGYLPNTNNHYFIVNEDTPAGKDVPSIDGNMPNPKRSDKSPVNSVFARCSRTRTEIQGPGGIFYRPRFETMR
ncbi:MAG: peptidoglycan-binding protein [Planctomycetia bacterium]|nr:peptidoglycan-binding protein [Planctomycetia bacterium]